MTKRETKRDRLSRLLGEDTCAAETQPDSDMN